PGNTILESNGNLQFKESAAKISIRAPVFYQQVDGVKKIVAGRYIAKRTGAIGFESAVYDTAKPLIVDPVIVLSTYLGGSGDEQGAAIAVDSSNNVYVTGFTDSTNFPTKNPFQPAYAGGNPDSFPADVFVTKFDPSGTNLIYSTYLGGSRGDLGHGIAVDSDGNAYITGSTNSTDFPTTLGAFQTTLGGGTCNNNAHCSDAFIAKLNPTGSALVFSTYLGGSADDGAGGIALDGNRNVYVCGTSESPNFPVKNPLQTWPGVRSAIVSKLTSDGSALSYSTFLSGPAGTDNGSAIAVDSSGSAYVTGTSGLNTIFVMKLTPAGTGLAYSVDEGATPSAGNAIALDSGGSAYIAGVTPALNNGNNKDAFVFKLSPDGNALIFSKRLTGNGTNEATGIAVDSSGNAYVVGSTTSSNFLLMNPVQSAYGGVEDAFISEISADASALLFSSYLGGSDQDAGRGVALDATGNLYVTGLTLSFDFPTVTPFQATNGGGGNHNDAFVAKIAFPNTPAPVVTFSPTSQMFPSTVVGVQSSPLIVQIQNTGTAPLNISAVGITGTDMGDYSQQNNCQALLAVGTSCTSNVTFNPTAPGQRTA